MKQFVLIITVILFFSCNVKKGQKEIESERPIGLTEIKFNEEIRDFGILEAGEIVVFDFIFDNTGNDILKIKKVVSDCGCVKTNFSKKHIEIGNSGTINVEFDTSGLYGKQYKTIEIQANFKEPKHLAIFAEIKNKQIEINL